MRRIPNLRRLVPIVLLVIVIVAAVSWLVVATRASDSLSATGTVEAESVRIAPEVGGRLVDVRAELGEAVAAGQILLVLDDSLLQAQIEMANAGLSLAEDGVRAAEASVAAARLQHEIAAAVARLEDAGRRARVWRETAAGDIDWPTWYLGDEERLAAAQESVAHAEAELKDASARLESLLKAPVNEPMRTAEQRLARAQAEYLAADAAYGRARVAWDPFDLLDASRRDRDEAEAERDEAQEAFDELLEGDAYAEIRDARAEVAQREAVLDAALVYRDSLWVGDLALPVQLAEASLRQTEATAARAASTLSQAKAELALLETQRERLTVAAPRDGVVLARSANPGEVLSPGTPALTLGDLTDLTITVFLAEDRYGEVRLGQAASIAVDSFPDVSFEGRVVRIADRAEFTPRNVQTETGRRSTVFAVQLAIQDPSGRLKPGMPADVVFATDG